MDARLVAITQIAKKIYMAIAVGKPVGINCFGIEARHRSAIQSQRPRCEDKITALERGISHGGLLGVGALLLADEQVFEVRRMREQRIKPLVKFVFIGENRNNRRRHCLGAITLHQHRLQRPLRRLRLQEQYPQRRTIRTRRSPLHLIVEIVQDIVTDGLVLPRIMGARAAKQLLKSVRIYSLAYSVHWASHNTSTMLVNKCLYFFAGWQYDADIMRIVPQIENVPVDFVAQSGPSCEDVPMITDTAQLENLCQRLRDEDFIAIDTEFMRDHTYYPRLCLIQIAGQEEAVVVDPLANEGGLDLAPLYELLRCDNIIKVFHAARQDIEIFFHDANFTPTPVFDTQVAAMVCGFGEAVSYATLVRRFLGENLDKSSRLTDWSRRPLSPKQLNYALDDVVHLRHVYEALSKELEESGRTSWVEEEMARLVAHETYCLDPRDAWKRLRKRPRSRRGFGVLVEVAAWRETLAQKRNVPRTRILKDEGIQEVITSVPKTRQHLERLRAVPQGFSNSKFAQSLLEAVATGEARAKDPNFSLPKNHSTVAPPALVQANAELFELLKLLLKLQCARHRVAAKLVTDTSTLEAFAVAKVGEEHIHPILSGWRKDVFGALALEAKRGNIAIGVEGDQLRIFDSKNAPRLTHKGIPDV